MRTSILIIFILFSIPVIAHTATLDVPGLYPTIQDAINAASAGDTVLVAPGTYVENIDFIGKAITVKSSDGPDGTVIDGGNPSNPDFGSVVSFLQKEGPDSVLEGFTVTNGPGTWIPGGNSGYYGGGIGCFNEASPLIIGNIITGNKTNGFAGIGCADNSSPTIFGNIITENVASGLAGSCAGGIGCNAGSTAKIINNIITNNKALGKHGYTPVATGGGIGCFSGTTPVISNNIIAGNESEYGGGIIIWKCPSFTFSGNEIYNNTATGGYYHKGSMGGGILIAMTSTANIHNNRVYDNFADYCGGGIAMIENSTTELLNTTIFGNSSGVGGGGIGMWNANATATNIILWNNNSTMGPEIYITQPVYPSTLTISCSNVEGGKALAYVDPDNILNWGSGMIESAPLFVDSANGDFHLTFNSPCRASGDNSAVTELYDFEGDPRIAYGTVDMGADEFYTHLYYMGDVTPGGNVEIKLVGLPGTMPVGLIIGFSMCDPPLKSMWGDWCVAYPWIGPINLGSIPTPDGVMVVPGSIPGTPSGPYSLYMQAIIDAELTNLCTLEVK